MASLKLFPLLVLSLSIISTAAQQPTPPPPPPPQSLVNAVETLASSGYTAMSLTLQLITPSLPFPSATTTFLTIFAPPDAVFSSFGQPSLSHLLLHFSPLSLSPTSLLSFPVYSTIPSLSPSRYLTITTNQPKNISINNVRVSEVPIFDDGFVIVYAIDNFLDLYFTLTRQNSTKSNPKSDVQCLKLERVSRFKEASGVLRSRGYSIMASFLELQLSGFTENVTKWTVFAPLDEDLLEFSGDFPGYFSLFMRHLAPCRVEWSDLEEMESGSTVSNNMKGFKLEFAKDQDEILTVNGVKITFPNMYDSEWLVIHGIRDVIALPESTEEKMELVEISTEEIDL